MIGLTVLAAASLANSYPDLSASRVVATDPPDAASAPLPEPILPKRKKPRLAEHSQTPSMHHRAKAKVSPIARVRIANRSALLEPGRDDFLGSVQVYPWTEGALYRLYTAPGRVSDIALEAGERLNSVAAGDTVRWIVGDTESGSGPTRQTHVLVKPTVPGLKTNLVIATDRRVYHVEAQSIAGPSMTSISWTYPESALLALKAPATPAPQAAGATGFQVETLNFNYRIEGDAVPWRPLRAFDDGKQVFIQFPASLGNSEAPPLFVRGASGGVELVNYRVHGRYYVVDRLFGEAELRLGERRQMVVRIVREGRNS